MNRAVFGRKKKSIQINTFYCGLIILKIWTKNNSIFGHMVAGKTFGIAADLMERKVMKKENHKNMPKTTSRNRLALIG